MSSNPATETASGILWPLPASTRTAPSPQASTTVASSPLAIGLSRLTVAPASSSSFGPYSTHPASARVPIPLHQGPRVGMGGMTKLDHDLPHPRRGARLGEPLIPRETVAVETRPRGQAPG